MSDLYAICVVCIYSELNVCASDAPAYHSHQWPLRADPHRFTSMCVCTRVYVCVAAHWVELVSNAVVVCTTIHMLYEELMELRDEGLQMFFSGFVLWFRTHCALVCTRQCCLSDSFRMFL